MKFVTDPQYRIKANGQKAKDAMNEVGECTKKAIEECYSKKTMTQEAYESHMQKFLGKKTYITVISYGEVEKIDQYGNRWEDWMDGKSNIGNLFLQPWQKPNLPVNFIATLTSMQIPAKLAEPGPTPTAPPPTAPPPTAPPLPTGNLYSEDCSPEDRAAWTEYLDWVFERGKYRNEEKEKEREKRAKQEEEDRKHIFTSFFTGISVDNYYFAMNYSAAMNDMMQWSAQQDHITETIHNELNAPNVNMPNIQCKNRICRAGGDLLRAQGLVQVLFGMI